MFTPKIRFYFSRFLGVHLKADLLLKLQYKPTLNLEEMSGLDPCSHLAINPGKSRSVALIPQKGKKEIV